MRKSIWKKIGLGLVILLVLVLTACNDSVTATPSANNNPPTTAFKVNANQPQVTITAPPNKRLGYVDSSPAIVDGVEISAADFNKALDTARVTSEEQAGGTLDWNTPDNQKQLQDLRQQVLEGLINYQVVANQAQKENVAASPADIQSHLDDFRQQLGGDIAYQNWLTKRFLSDADQRNAIVQVVIFEKMEALHSAVEDKAEQVHVRHILLQTEAEAKKIYDQLRSGADFAALAKQFSLDAASASKGGDLDFIFPGQTAQYGPDFERVAFALKPNEFSGPIKTPLGYHIIQSLGKEVRPLPFDYVQQRKSEAFSNYIKTLRDKAKIEKKL